jgi:hypothetical protein
MTRTEYTHAVARKNRNHLKFSRKGEYFSTTGVRLKYCRKVYISNGIVHYVFKNGKREYSFRVIVFPYLQAMGEQMTERDTVGLLKTSDVLWASLRGMGY